MIDFSEAFELATQHYQSKGERIVLQARESTDFWIFIGGHKGRVQCIDNSIKILKEDAQIEWFSFLEMENHEIFENAKLLYDVEEE